MAADTVDTLWNIGASDYVSDGAEVNVVSIFYMGGVTSLTSRVKMYVYIQEWRCECKKK